MSRFCPHYPTPAPTKLSALRIFLSKRRSWLDGLYERSYQMKMGEVHLPGVDLYVPNEPSLTRKVLVEEARRFPKNQIMAEGLHELLGNSVLTSNGAVWQRQRSLMNPSFEVARVSQVYDRMQAAADAMVERLRRVEHGTVHDMEREMSHAAADIIVRTIVSQSLDGSSARTVFDAFANYQALSSKLIMPRLFGLKWLQPWWLVKRSRQAANEIRNLLADLIRPRYDAFQAKLAQGVPLEQADTTDDILAGLLRARDAVSGERFSFEDLIDQVGTLFLAGHETSASAMSWSVYLLACVPEVQERLHAEALDKLPGVGDDPSRLKDMTLARDVFREALRLYPPIGFLVRQAAEACELRDKQVKAGASVVVSPWLMHRHRELWARPDEFDPDRYTRDEPNDSPSCKESLRRAYMPFGQGPRACIGGAFALQEAALLLATLATHFRFETGPGPVPEPVGRVTVRPDNGIHVKVFQRSQE